MIPGGHIPVELYATICEHTAILCVDVVLRGLWPVVIDTGVAEADVSGPFFLVRRSLPPLEGRLWVIGGRVHKCETIEVAAARKVREETGLMMRPGGKPVGFYEDVFHASPYDTALHTVSIVWEGWIDNSQPLKVKLDEHHTDWKWDYRLPQDFVSQAKLWDHRW